MGIICQRGDKMKYLMLLILICTFVFFPSDLQAAQNETQALIMPHSVGVVIVGDNYFRVKDFYNIIASKMGKRFPILDVGDNPQGEYRKYWDNKGLLKEPEPTRDDLFAFAKIAPYEKVLFLIITPSTLDTTPYNGITIYHANLQVRALLIDTATQNVVADKETTQADHVAYNLKLRAQESCFKLVMDYFAKNL